ncbi:autotransporter domain-containing protein [Nitrincola sp.]|uniref:autotransporter domain-containing protein n=1 Tax=Nitrincola sp. TaxID=1926584 RepID=UPI003A90C9BF
MNQVYNVIWNVSHQVWMAVGELTSARGKSSVSLPDSIRSHGLCVTGAIAALVLAISTGSVWADVETTGDVNHTPTPNPLIGDWDLGGNNLIVGVNATGTLTINDGSAVTNGAGIIGYLGSIGNSSVTVEGAGSRWTNSGIVSVGTGSTGSLAISDGGVVASTRGYIGREFSGSSGSVTVSGMGSLWTNSVDLFVGHAGTDSLAISDGGEVVNTNGYIGFSGSTGTGSVTVDGEGSRWTNSGELYVGIYSIGNLSISNGGVVSASSAFIAYFGGTTGTLNIGVAAGDTAVAAGTLNAETLAFGSVYGVGTGNLVFNHTESAYNFAPNITGLGAIRLLAGTTRFTGNLNDYTGTMIVDGGMLSVAAGDTLILGGNYTQTADGVFKVGVTDDTTYGKLVVDGTAALPSNARIDVDVSNPGFGFITAVDNGMAGIISATILDSDGTFTVTDNSTLFNFGAQKVDNQVNLTLSAAAAGEGESSNGLTEQIVVAKGNAVALGAARALDSIFVSDPSGPIATLFVPFTTDDQVNTAISQTLPLLAGGSQVAATSALTGMNRVVQARIESNRGLSSGDHFYGDEKFWLKPFGSWADQDDRRGVSGYKSNTAGLAFGGDTTVSDATRLGLSFAYARSSVDGNSTLAPNSAKVDVYQLIGYGSHALDEATEINFQLGVGQNRNKGTRDLSSFGTRATSRYDSLVATAGAGVGRNITLSDTTTFTPSVRADYSWIRDEGYTETGAGPLNLKVTSRTTDELILAMDGKLTQELKQDVLLSANLGLGYDLLNEQTSITSSFAGAPGAAFTTKGMDPSPWLARGGLGLATHTAGGMEVSARYDAEYRQDFLNQTASIKLRWAF